MVFRQVIDENVKKKKKSFHSKDIYIYGSETFWSFTKFYPAHNVKVCFVFNYAYISPCIHKILPTLGNEKEQLNFTKIIGRVDFLAGD